MGEIQQTEITEEVIQILEENPLKDKDILQMVEENKRDKVLSLERSILSGMSVRI